MKLKTKQHQLVISNVIPSIQGGLYPIKRVLGQSVTVRADIFGEGHRRLEANLLWRKKKSANWNRTPMHHVDNDCWEAIFTPETTGEFEYTIEAWFDCLGTWKEDLIRKIESNVFTPMDLEPGIEALRSISDTHIEQSIEQLSSTLLPKELLEVIRNLQIPRDPASYQPKQKVFTHQHTYSATVKRKRANFSSWYEVFPRSCSDVEGEHGTFRDVIDLIPAIADMGFDVIYFPPIHPIGLTNRKGKNNSKVCSDGDPGSPWAIGSKDGGHRSIHPSLGTLEDFHQVIEVAKANDLEIALDIAFQCSPDHPYLKEHPEWFKWRSDGSIQFAENPPKKYEDIVPFDFDSENSEELWIELKSIVEYWVNQGIKIFRVDNPHTKPFDMWEWLIAKINELDPDVIFLSEAFTRPKVMQQLSLLGFDQSYTYFTWRNTKHELIEYMNELHQDGLPEHFRPCFWPNTPDILPEYLQYGGKPAFISRFVLASTLSSNYGIYGPTYEYCVGEAIDGREEYLNSEKYELKTLSQYDGESIRPLIKSVNTIRNSFSALQTTWNVYFCETENDHLLAYLKFSQNDDPDLLIVVNIDYTHPQDGMITIPLDSLGIDREKPYAVHDLIDGEKYVWSGARNYVKLDPHKCPAHIFALSPHLHEEQEFNYYM